MAAIPTFNIFRIRRSAHAVSSSGDARFNPFGHIWRVRARQATLGCDEPVAFNIDSEHQPGDDENPPVIASLMLLASGAVSDPGLVHQRRIQESRSDNDVLQSPRSSYSIHSMPELRPRAMLQDHDALQTRFRRAPATLRSSVDHITVPVMPRKRGERQLGIFKRRDAKVPYSVGNQIQRTVLASWINVLLVCIPTGMALSYSQGPSVAAFFVNYAAVVPLYFLVDLAMESIEARSGRISGAFISASVSNLFQLISCIILLVNRKITVIRLSLVGDILANILLLLGLSFIIGGFRRQEQFFNMTVAQTSSVMLSLASTSLLIPTAATLLSQTTLENVTKQSRAPSVVLIIVYFLFLFFSLITHHKPWIEETVEKFHFRLNRNKRSAPPIGESPAAPVPRTGTGLPEDGPSDNNRRLRELLEDLDAEESEDGGVPDPQLDLRVALVTFIASAVLLYFCTDNIVNSMDALIANSGLSATFVGLVLLPIPNCDTASLTLAYRDNLDSTMELTVIKSVQTALFITPFIVLLAWWLDVEGMTLVFDGFEVVSIFATIILLNFMIAGGKSHWLQGILLLADWTLIAIAAFFVD